MVYLLGGGVFLWVLLRRILFKMWWCVALLAFTMPAVADDMAPSVKLYIKHGDGYPAVWHSYDRTNSQIIVPLTDGVGYFFLAVDPTTSPLTATWLRHAVTVNNVRGAYVRVDIWGPLISLTTYRTVGAEHTTTLTDRFISGSTFGWHGWVATPDPNDGYPDDDEYINVLTGTSRAPDGEEEAYGDVEFDDPAAQYWLDALMVSHTAWMSLPVKDDDDIADPTSSYFPEPDSGLSASDAVTAIEDAFENADDFDPSGYEGAAESMLHDDLVPTLTLPANSAALKSLIHSGMTSLTGSATWLYNEETTEIDVSSQLSTLLGSGATAPVPYLFETAIDLLENTHGTFLPIFETLRTIFTVLFTISIIFMMFRLFLWSLDIQRPIATD